MRKQSEITLVQFYGYRWRKISIRRPTTATIACRVECHQIPACHHYSAFGPRCVIALRMSLEGAKLKAKRASFPQVLMEVSED